MSGLAHTSNPFWKRRSRADAIAEELQNQVAELEGKLATSDALVLQLRRDLEASHAVSDDLERERRTTISLRGELVNRTARVNQLQDRHDDACQQLSEQGAQVEDLKACVVGLKAEADARIESERKMSAYALQRVRRQWTQRLGEPLAPTDQQDSELSTRIQVLEEEGRAKDTRAKQMEGRLDFAGQRAYELRARLQQNDRTIHQLTETTQQLESKVQDQDRNTRDLEAKIQQKDRDIEQLEVKLRQQRLEDGNMLYFSARQAEDNRIFWQLQVLSPRHSLSFRNVAGRTTIGGFKEQIQQRTSIPAQNQRLSLSGIILENRSESTIHIAQRLVVRKPVITLYPRQRQRTTVRLGLCDGFDFTYLHPTDVSLDKVKTLRDVSWQVWVDPNGTITTDKGHQVSYLFWEGFYDQSGSIDVSFGPHQSQKTFMVSIDDLPSFLDNFMERCGFPTKERQDMVTYWAPQLLQHDYAAIRFLGPSEYHTVAPLAVQPCPDRLVRLFALFKGIEARAACEWQGLADAEVENQVEVMLQGNEKPVIGAEFCAFEWGGMIVK
ncbi:hypothetical protein FGG08_003105 [Glutinoglossum americanum]|uniref:Ubiquitin-like domain-containing protein n=1 Tax=Glutinoglossum americanum TaxID=1670608 RepID=A0A9P8L3X2_9PEZI|nr:hypothetical protein FGG08_003105 [Glutinoglossum americanum]